MVKVNDKIILVKAMGMFDNVGEICNVVEVDDEYIYFSFGEGMHMGGMTHDEFDKYFEIYEAPKMDVDINSIMEKCELINTWAFNIASTIAELQEELAATQEVEEEEEVEVEVEVEVENLFDFITKPKTMKLDIDNVDMELINKLFR